MRRAAFIGALLAVAQGAWAETLAERLQSPGSHAAVTLELPYEAVTRLLSDDLDRDWQGRRKDVSDRLSDDELEWSAKVREVSAGPAQQGGLRLRAVAEGEIDVKGRLAGIFFDETVDLRVRVDLSALPRLRGDYSLELEPTGRARLERAELDLWGLEIDLRRRLQPRLDRAVDRALRERAEELASEPVLKESLADVWQDACADAGAMGAFRPVAIAATQPRFEEEAVRLTLVVTAQLRLEPMACPPLPERLDLLED
ncbi:DUF4403 family protein [Histidinibacterium aquaticum]|nr:DUF4403 family protein [Histidinibacterium aquaticum]